MSERESKSSSLLSGLLFVVGGLLVLLSSLSLELRIWRKVIEGRGHEFYTSFFGVKWTYYGAASVSVITLLAVLVGVVLWWLRRREEQDLLRKYGKD